MRCASSNLTRTPWVDLFCSADLSSGLFHRYENFENWWFNQGLARLSYIRRCLNSIPLLLTRWSLITTQTPHQRETPPPAPISPPPWPQAPTAAQPTPHPLPEQGSPCTQAPSPSSCLSPWQQPSCCSAPVEADPPTPDPHPHHSCPSPTPCSLLQPSPHRRPPD